MFARLNYFKLIVMFEVIQLSYISTEIKKFFMLLIEVLAFITKINNTNFSYSYVIFLNNNN